MAEWVVRAGIAEAEKLIDGYEEHVQRPGLYGFSVQYAPGKTIDELAQAGQFRNAQISFASDDHLADALWVLGYRMALIASPDRGYHTTFVVLIRSIWTDDKVIAARCSASHFSDLSAQEESLSHHVRTI